MFHDDHRPDENSVSDASLTICHYIPPGKSPATSNDFHNGNIASAPLVRPHRGPWLQLGLTRQFEWNCYDLAIESLPQTLRGMRIIHLTDSHLRRRWWPAYDALIARLKQDPPDLILFTGDFVDDKFDHRHALPNLERLLTQMTSRLGIFAVTGNHDGDLLVPRLPGWGVTLLNRTFMRLESDHAAIELIGLAGTKRGDFDPEFIASIPARPSGVPRIVLGHFPDLVRHIAPLRADAMLAGHTHGGQVCLPRGIPILTHDTLPRKMARGAHRIGQTLLVVNRGFGVARLPIRVFCPTEVVELKLV